MDTVSSWRALKKVKALLGYDDKRSILLMMVFAIITSVSEVAAAAFIALFAKILMQPDSGRQYFEYFSFFKGIEPLKIVLYSAILCGVMFFFKNLLASAEIFFQNYRIQKIAYQFKNKMLDRYSDLSYEFYLRRNTAFSLSIMEGEIDSIFTSGLTPLAIVATESLILIFLIVMVIFMNPSLAVIIFSLGLTISFLVVKILLPINYRSGEKLLNYSIFGRKLILEYFHAFKEIILTGNKRNYIKMYGENTYNRYRAQALITSLNNLPRAVVELFVILIFVVCVSYLCVVSTNMLEMVSVLGGYLYVGFRLMPGLNRIISQLALFKGVIPSVNRVYEEYMNLREKCYASCPDLAFKKSIVIEGLSYKYSCSENDALENINLTMNKGEWIGIAGETGSGKSTFVDLVLGLLEPQKGSILIDGTFKPNTEQWHQKIGYVPQSLSLFDNTIEANITFCEDKETVDRAQLEEVIKQSQLDKFVDKLPEGLNTIVGDRGIRLSGGERQRISIARALYRKPEVIIFDEATSALDNKTEANLMNTIREAGKGKTVIMIAHRLTTLRDCDKIIVLKDGKVEKLIESRSDISKLVS